MNKLAMIPVAKLRPSSVNVRRHMDEGRLDELIESVRAHGVLQPLLVRPLKEDMFEVVAGNRRLQAAIEARIENVPCHVEDLDDTAAVECQVIENLQREDVHPLEEAAGYVRLLKTRKIEELAGTMGKSVSYIYQRLQLQKLEKPAEKAFEEGLLTTAHATEIARLKPPEQKEVLQSCLQGGWGGPRVLSVRALRQFIAKEILHDLHAAPWKKDDSELVPKAGPCTTCPKNARNMPLWEDLKKRDTCTDATCYREKWNTWLRRRAEEAGVEGKPAVLISRDATYERRDRDRENASVKLMPAHQVRELKKSDRKCEAEETAVVGAGDGIGKTVRICRDTKCKVHAGGPRSAALSMQDARQREELRKRERARRIEFEARRRALAQGLEKITWPVSRATLDLLVEGLAGEVWHEVRKAVCSRRGWTAAEKARKAGPVGTLDETIVKQLPGLGNAEALQLAVELALGHTMMVPTYIDRPKDIEDVGDRFARFLRATGIHLDHHREAVRKEQETRKKAGGPKGKA